MKPWGKSSYENIIYGIVESILAYCLLCANNFQTNYVVYPEGHVDRVYRAVFYDLVVFVFSSGGI